MLLVYWIMITSPLYQCFTHQNLHMSQYSKVLMRMSTTESSAYGDTQTGVKVIIQGLTSFSNLFLSSSPVAKRVYEKTNLTPNEILNGVIGDFENGYLFSGQIDSEIYDEDCVFTDPTLSFKGLSTFERNIKALKPALDIFVGDSSVVLYDCKIDQEAKEVKAIWRMSGAVNLPWKPRIELTGNTVLSYDSDRGGRIVDYYERWDLPAATALLQLLQPSKKRAEKIALLGATATLKAESGENNKALTETINVKKLKAAVLLSVSSKSASSSDRSAIIANAVSLLIRGSSKEALNSRDKLDNSLIISENQAASLSLQELQNSAESSYELLYSSVKTSNDEDVLENLISKIQNSFPVIKFSDLDSPEGVMNSLSKFGPFSTQIAASCIQPDSLEATLLISQKKLKVKIIDSFCYLTFNHLRCSSCLSELKYFYL